MRAFQIYFSLDLMAHGVFRVSLLFCIVYLVCSTRLCYGAAWLPRYRVLREFWLTILSRAPRAHVKPHLEAVAHSRQPVMRGSRVLIGGRRARRRDLSG